MARPTIRFQNSTEFLKFRASPLFNSALDTSSCLNAILEMEIEKDILEVINLINNYQMPKKHLHLIVSLSLLYFFFLDNYTQFRLLSSISGSFGTNLANQ